nr:chromosome segregation protein SMC [candidate division Zixibacteria bacterium]
MYLKRLELLGFKSFPDKTIIKFTPGVTSIVGPNGCGKTNILDSIRWVLGEQKVSLLRGTKMEEIIFNGTRDVKPLGMAEVTLVVQNNKGVLPTEYNEVQITRRLFRSGESEYLLNKVPCRLKDIQELLMDTGMGSHIYSVIQQDMIEAILSDKADERRFLFEEAAGISKYKNRKKAALRKLDATEGDLLRLKDIVAEVNSQVNALKRQMNKAQRYKSLSEELKAWEIFLSKNNLTQLARERHELLIKRDQASDIKIKADTDIDRLSAIQEEDRKRLTDIDRLLTEAGNEIYIKSEEAHAVEMEITQLRERRDHARQTREKNLLDIEAFKKRKSILYEQIDEIEKNLVSLDEELARTDRETENARVSLSSVDEELLAARRDRDEIHKKLMAVENQLTAGRSDDSNLKEQKSEIDSGLANYDIRTEELNNRRNGLVDSRSALETELTSLREKMITLQSERTELEETVVTLNEQAEEVSGNIFDLTASLEAAEARCHLLKEMVTQYEGYGSGVVAVMDIRERWPGLVGTVADNFTPRPGFEEAVETALGELAEFMICHDRTTAEDIIAYLRNEKKGKAGLLIAEMADSENPPTRPHLHDEGFIGWADDYVATPDDFKPLAKLILSRIALVQAEAAERIMAQLPPFFTLVTPEGKQFQGKAVVSGGSREGVSLLGRKEKIREQEQLINDLRDKLNIERESRNRITSSVGARQAELGDIHNRLESLREEIEKSEREITARKYEIEMTAGEMHRIARDRKELAVKLESLQNRQYSLDLNYDQLAREKDNITAELQEQDKRIKILETGSDEAEASYSNLQIRQIELKSKKQQLQSQIKHTNELVFEIDSNSRDKSDEIVRVESDTRDVGDKINELEINLKAAFDARSEISERQNKIRDEYSALQEQIDNREREIKTTRQSREEAGNNLHDIEIRMTEIDSEAKNVRQKIQEEYDLDLEEITAEPPDPNVPVEEHPARMQELKERLKDFGGVNLLALEEYDTARERQEFLTTQMEDLLSAKSTLQSTISKINQTAKRLFMETFEKVRQNFKEVFEELFTGGEADINLVDIEDPLESPIEITARPRGKKLLSIAQMSGGEKALTAISLLFSIYLAKPSPFCILDEIDAPLDDANIHRFLRIIRTFSEQTQFIIITHNKITMEAADILYGITMEQPGISKVLSVRFNDEDEERIIDTAVRDEKPAVEPDIPEAVRERMTSQVNIGSTDETE